MSSQPRQPLQLRPAICHATRTRRILNSLLLALSLLVAACDRGRTTLSLWAMGSEGEAIRQLIPEFEQRHPAVRVEVQQLPWSAAHEKLLTAFVGGSLPDVFQLGSTWIAELATVGALLPLDAPMAASDFDAADFFPAVLAGNRIHDTTYAVPWYVDTRLLFYRRSLFARAGASAAPQTWDDWRQAMQKIRNQDANCYGTLLLPSEWQPIVIWALQLGAPLLREEATRGHFDEPAFRRALAFYLELVERDLAPRAGEAQLANLYQELGNGRLASFISGPWNIGELRRRLPADASLWSTTVMPSPNRGEPGASIAGGASIAVAATTRQPKLAWQLAEHLTSSAAQLALYRATGDLPARRSAWQQGRLAEDPQTSAFWQQLQHLMPLPAIPEWERIAAKIMQHVDAAGRGSESLDDAVTSLDREVDDILAKRRAMMSQARNSGS